MHDERTSTRTRARPTARMCSERAALSERSMMRPLTYGPLSITGTLTARPLPRCVTRTHVPIAKVRCAALGRRGSKTAPLAVLRPVSRAPYHEAIPISVVVRTPSSERAARAAFGMTQNTLRASDCTRDRVFCLTAPFRSSLSALRGGVRGCRNGRTCRQSAGISNFIASRK